MADSLHRAGRSAPSAMFSTREWGDEELSRFGDGARAADGFDETALLGRALTEESLARTLKLPSADQLCEVTEAELLVDTTAEPVEALGGMLPALTELRLSDSRIPSFRDLGLGLGGLRVLWVARCGIPHLDGLAAMPLLRELYAAFNDVDDTLPLTDLEHLETLDLEGNAVHSLNAVGTLSSCPSLAEVTLAGNPIATVPLYRRAVAGAIPQLRLLDDRRVADSERSELDPALARSLAAAARIVAEEAGGDAALPGDEEEARLARAMDDDEADAGDGSRSAADSDSGDDSDFGGGGDESDGARPGGAQRSRV
ncbi:hypothetical protein FNF29_00803 [Cafeteria roenbergensis]|uniref:U2A'/phosphoprotein 32 family A C-terminal domain-containing protein n=1 Tax=Cafeteria roenbergensis TaxID=33653 RepID=A0A5A8CU67_CAFRO|nr:hypothetical protein FNF29_00803 [Cafeteria roenbergensis]|eukprot:KAA0156692.1 hypothetical protein FNF29_00803 [Cafeteria roenbergensis]